MKKYLLSFSMLLAMAVAFSSCSSDKDPQKKPDNTQEEGNGNSGQKDASITLSLSKTEAFMGEELTFEVKDNNGKPVPNTDLEFTFVGKGDLASKKSEELGGAFTKKGMLILVQKGEIDVTAKFGELTSTPVTVKTSYNTLNPNESKTEKNVYILDENEFLHKVWNFKRFGGEIASYLDRPVVIKFGATWCGPCQAAKPLLEKIAEEYKDKAYVLDFDVDHSFPATAFRAFMKIRKDNEGAIPYIVMIAQGTNQVQSMVGYSDKAVRAFLQKNVAK